MRVCVLVCAHICARVIREIKLPFQAISLKPYVRIESIIFIKWDNVFVLKCAGDVASCGTSYSRIKRRPSIFT